MGRGRLGILIPIEPWPGRKTGLCLKVNEDPPKQGLFIPINLRGWVLGTYISMNRGFLRIKLV